MFIGLLLLLLPVVVYIATFSLSCRLKQKLCILYRVGAGIIAMAGTSFSVYLAAYSGDQGGIAAYFFQLAVIGFYALFSVTLLVINYLLKPGHRDD